MAKNDNMLAILWMLNSGKKITAKQMADKLEINIRTVYRYIDSLCSSGVPIVSDIGQKGGYYLMNQFIQSPLFFDVEEQKALLQATEFAKSAGYPYNEAIDKATNKLKLYTTAEQNNLLNRQLIGIEVMSKVIDFDEKSMLMEIDQSIANEYSIEIQHRSKKEEQITKRVLDPYGIIFWNNKWYTIGFCHLRQKIRSFRVDRIIGIKKMNNRFVRPKAFSAHSHFLKTLFPAQGSEGNMTSLIITGRAEALDDLCNHWFLSHHLKERSQNHAVFSIEETTLSNYVPYFFLAYGKSIDIAEPQSFREKMISTASELIEYYQK